MSLIVLAFAGGLLAVLSPCILPIVPLVFSRVARPRDERALMLAAPEVWGAQEVSSKQVTMRVVVKTAPLRQWSVEREMRARIKAALDAAGVRFPPPASDD